MNKYTKWYNQIIASGIHDYIPGYERHHILPRSLNGTDEKSNLIYITPRQHFICHWLLIKIYSTGEEHWKMLNALRMMRAENPNQKRYHTKITSRVYERLKLEYAALQSERMRGENNPMYQRPVSEEVRKGRSLRARGDNNPAKKPGVGEKIRQSKLGKKRPKFDEEWLANIKAARQGEKNGMYGKKHSEETRLKISQRAKLRKNSVESNLKRAEANRGSKREKIQCPHCRQMIAVNVYPRWHGDRCRIR